MTLTGTFDLPRFAGQVTFCGVETSSRRVVRSISSTSGFSHTTARNAEVPQ